MDPEKIGKKIADIEILPLSLLEETIKKHNIKLGIIAVPAQSAQEVANRLIDSGVRGIINFAPININVGDGIMLRRVDLAAQLEYLTYYLEDSK